MFILMAVATVDNVDRMPPIEQPLPTRPTKRRFGDCKAVGEGVSELRVVVGSGYRVYYGKHGQTLVILLCGGDKSSQHTDITHAKAYWADWKRRNS